MATSSKLRNVKYDEPLWGSHTGFLLSDNVGYYVPTLTTDYIATRPKVEIKKTAIWLSPIEIGDKSYFLPRALFHLTETIHKSKQLLTLKEDWDDDGALAVDKKIYYRSLETLIEYALNVHDVYNVAIKSPYISAGRDGSIDLEWETPNATLLITILNSNEFNLHYYGDDGNNNTVIKGMINDSQINEDLAHWMRKL